MSYFFRRQIRRYVGPARKPPSLEIQNQWTSSSAKIRRAAQDIWDKFRSIFQVREGQDFEAIFEKQVAAFKAAIVGLSGAQTTCLVDDPTV